MPTWNDMGAALNTLRELDVSAIREESERPVSVLCTGSRTLFEQASALLRAPGLNRYGPGGTSPLSFLDLRAVGGSAHQADLVVAMIDGREPIASADAAALTRIAATAPTVIAICSVDPTEATGTPQPAFAEAQIVVLPDLKNAEAAAALATAIFKRLPGELHLSFTRRLPGARDVYARELIGSVSFTNASYAAASAIPEQIPILAVPFVAADMIVLTKNQALMVYRLALAYGAPPEFRERLREVAPVIGGGLLWRQLARSLVALIPIWGVVPKVAIAYAGTYATGVAAGRWFADGELITGARLRQLSAEALQLGRQRAAELVAVARNQVTPSSPLRRRVEQIRRRLPGAGRRPKRPVGEQGGAENR
ncbi:MAG: hypothetical protein OHK0015_04220 [Chloroflexi bacterium OHK40]